MFSRYFSLNKLLKNLWSLQGSPYPSQEQNAADVVMHYALHELGFKPEDIIVYGWSIGGYTSTWMAMNYPQVSTYVLNIAIFLDYVHSDKHVFRFAYWFKQFAYHTRDIYFCIIDKNYLDKINTFWMFKRLTSINISMFLPGWAYKDLWKDEASPGFC